MTFSMASKGLQMSNLIGVVQSGAIKTDSIRLFPPERDTPELLVQITGAKGVLTPLEISGQVIFHFLRIFLHIARKMPAPLTQAHYYLI